MLYEDVVIYENVGGSPDKTVGKAGMAFLRGNDLICIMMKWKGKSGSGNIFRKVVVQGKNRPPKLSNNLLAGDNSFKYLIEIDRGNGLKDYFGGNLLEADITSATFVIEQKKAQAEIRPQQPWVRATPDRDLVRDEDIDDLVADLMS